MRDHIVLTTRSSSQVPASTDQTGKFFSGLWLKGGPSSHEEQMHSYRREQISGDFTTFFWLHSEN